MKAIEKVGCLLLVLIVVSDCTCITVIFWENYSKVVYFLIFIVYFRSNLVTVFLPLLQMKIRVSLCLCFYDLVILKFEVMFLWIWFRWCDLI